MEQESKSPEWSEKQKKLDAECDEIIAHPENYEHYHSFEELHDAILRDPEYQKGVAEGQNKAGSIDELKDLAAGRTKSDN